MERITFVIPTRNNLEFLKLAYKSIRNLKTKHEVLILDDASVDSTQEWIEALDDEDVLTYHNPGPDRIGIVGMFDKGIEMARTDIIMAFHADMVAGPNLDANILKHIKRRVVVSATRIEPPLHPPGPEKITQAWGNEVEDFNFYSAINSIAYYEREYENKTTTGIFAPWCMYREDYLAVGGHDELFAPQSKEDSDLFNRFTLNGYEMVQSWDALVYHFTSRGSRFNKHAGGSAGVNSSEWLHTTNVNMRNFIRKWGQPVNHDAYMKPIISPKYNIGYIVHNCSQELLSILEPWCDNIYIENGKSRQQYCVVEQPNTKFNLKDRVRTSNFNDLDKPNNILVEFNANKLTNENFQLLQQMPEIIKQTSELGQFELDIFTITIKDLTEYQNNLIHIYN